jgi:SAM-dependent methyltransferase
MPGRWAYDVLYRIGAAKRWRGWDKGIGPELVELVESGRITRESLAPGRAIDLGCGTGANILFLAERGFQGLGVDFSPVAVTKARQAAEARGLSDRARFVVADLTAPSIDGADGPYDLVVVYNTLQDLIGSARAHLAGAVHRLTRPGSLVLLWCWYKVPAELPFISLRGPSRLLPLVVAPGEEEQLFGQAFHIERLPRPEPDSDRACFLLSRRGSASGRGSDVDTPDGEGPDGAPPHPPPYR